MADETTTTEPPETKHIEDDSPTGIDHETRKLYETARHNWESIDRDLKRERQAKARAQARVRDLVAEERKARRAMDNLAKIVGVE